MKTISIIGVSKVGGLGNFLYRQLQEKGFDVKVIRRGETFDLAADIIILNLFDHRNVGYQEEVFKSVFEEVKDKTVQLVVVGSTAHLFLNNDYAIAKRSLRDTFYELGKHVQNYKCRMLMVEPGALEVIGKKKATVYHMLFQEFAEILSTLLVINPKFMHVAVRGDHEPVQLECKTEVIDISIPDKV